MEEARRGAARGAVREVQLDLDQPEACPIGNLVFRDAYYVPGALRVLSQIDKIEYGQFFVRVRTKR